MNARADNILTVIPRPLAEDAAADCYLISHYPTHLVDVRSLRDGRRLTLRPVLPQDNRLLADLVNRLSAQSRSRSTPLVMPSPTVSIAPAHAVTAS